MVANVDLEILEIVPHVIVNVENEQKLFVFKCKMKNNNLLILVYNLIFILDHMQLVNKTELQFLVLVVQDAGLGIFKIINAIVSVANEPILTVFSSIIRIIIFH